MMPRLKIPTIQIIKLVLNAPKGYDECSRSNYCFPLGDSCEGVVVGYGGLQKLKETGHLNGRELEDAIYRAQRSDKSKDKSRYFLKRGRKIIDVPLSVISDLRRGLRVFEDQDKLIKPK